MLCRHVDAVHIGVHHRRCGRGEVDLFGAGVTSHFYDAAGGVSADYAIIDNEDISALKFVVNRVEFLAN